MHKRAASVLGLVGAVLIAQPAAAQNGDMTAEIAAIETLQHPDIIITAADIPYAQWVKTVMPGQRIRFDFPNKTVWASGLPLTHDWHSDVPGSYHKIRIDDKDGKTAYEVSLFVLMPASRIDKKHYLDGYRIGTYPRRSPKGFIRLDKDQLSISVSPSFKIGQFLCKQQPGAWPKYILVSEDNLKRLEVLLAALQKDGLTEAKTLSVMSGFRTPAYNRAIGSARFSRHMFGDAADVYVDVSPRDDIMDDLNGDGKHNKKDADFLYDYAEELFAKTDGLPDGGLGSYRANSAHGPFVHVDGRGRKARWGRW